MKYVYVQIEVFELKWLKTGVVLLCDSISADSIL